ncbi:hypothetical protein V2J09_010114 [Rumex salicifolius]
MPHSPAAVLHRITTSTHTTTSAACIHRNINHQISSPAAVSEVDIPDGVARHHAYAVGSGQCCSAVVQEINAPVHVVWSVVRRFDNPQSYKNFVKSCDLLGGSGDLSVGCLRRVHVISGLPAATSTERLEILDDDRHVLSFSVVGGDHRLTNYRSVTTLHPAGDRTVVVESYVVDTPAGNTKEETCVFVDTIVKCNLQSLAQIAENLAGGNKI